MDKTDWLLIKALYTHKSMAKAAETLFLSQPAVSYRMTKMEREFEQTLFVRTNKGVSLTSAGLRLFTFSNLMLQYDSHIYSQVHQNDDILTGIISLGTTNNFMQAFLGNQLKLFHNLYPGINFHVQINSSNTLYKKMVSKELMMAVIRGQNDWQGPTIELFDEPLIIVSSEPVTEQMLHEKPIILNDYKSPVTQPMDEWISEYFYDSAPLISPIQISGDSITLKHLVKQGFGWAVISRTRLFPEDGLYYEPIHHRDGSTYHYKTHLIYSKECDGFDTYKTYIAHLTRYFADIKAQERV